MKVKVNRQLAAGRYHVSFEVSDFTPDELAKMSSFGVPVIEMAWFTNGATNAGRIALNQINKGLNAIFGSEQKAREYEEQVLNQIKSSMEKLRQSKDGFTSSAEVEL